MSGAPGRAVDNQDDSTPSVKVRANNGRLKRKRNIRSRPHVGQASVAAEALFHALLDFLAAALQHRTRALPLPPGTPARGSMASSTELQPVQSFLAAYTEQAFGYRVQSAKLHKAYLQWARAADGPR
jgi:hypothetical protein